MRLLYLLWLCVTIVSGGSSSWQPCPELSSALRYPCRCKVEPFGPKSQLGAVSMDCDYVVFHTESPILPNSAPVISFSQRHCGQQVLPTQVRHRKLLRYYLTSSYFFSLSFKMLKFSVFFRSFFSMQAYATTQLPLRSLDFSHNSIRRLPDKAFSGVEVSPYTYSRHLTNYTRKTIQLKFKPIVSVTYFLGANGVFFSPFFYFSFSCVIFPKY